MMGVRGNTSHQAHAPEEEQQSQQLSLGTMQGLSTDEKKCGLTKLYYISALPRPNFSPALWM